MEIAFTCHRFACEMGIFGCLERLLLASMCAVETIKLWSGIYISCSKKSRHLMNSAPLLQAA